MKFWFLAESRRLAQEKRVVEELAASESWFELDRWGFHEDKLAATGAITAHGAQYPIRLVYPEQYPEVPAWVEPQKNVQWSRHQYGSGGGLCLELRPDNWIPTATGADVLRSAYNLLAQENPLGANGNKARAPSAHHVGDIQLYGWVGHPVLIGAGCRDRVKAAGAHELKALRWMIEDNVWPILVHDSQDRASPRRPPGVDVYSWRLEIPVYISSNPAPAEAADRRALIDAGAFDPVSTEQIAGRGAALVLFVGGPELVAYHLHEDSV